MEAKGHRRYFQVYMGTVAMIFLFFGLAQGITRHRVKGIGYGTFFEYETASQPPPTAFFEDVTCGAKLITVTRQIAAIQKDYPNARIFFGPRMGWAYAALHLPSPVGLPVWWGPGTAFPHKDQPIYFHQWEQYHFDVIVLLEGNVIAYPNILVHQIQKNYKVAPKEYLPLFVFVPKQIAP